VSLENLKKYGQLCAEDKKIRENAKEIGLEDLEGHIANGKSLGLEFSKEDFVTLAKEAGLEGTNELSEEDLKKVAGGIGTATILLVAAVIAGCSILGAAGGAVAIRKDNW
jgi:predicted ribosomally synthesized peptide with nif11-like leader